MTIDWTMVGFISDIHGNLPALTAVLEDLRDIDHVVCLGDITSRPETDLDCLDLIMDRCTTVLRGNHDVIGYDPFIQSSMQPYLEDLIATSKYSESFPKLSYEAMILDDQVQIAHASPHEPIWHQCYSNAHLNSGFRKSLSEEKEFDLAMNASSAPLVIVGHMHLPMFARRGAGNMWSCHHQPPGTSQEFIKGDHVILNPGSVGEVRDAHIGDDYRARWMTLEDLGTTWRATWHGTEYEGMHPNPTGQVLWL